MKRKGAYIIKTPNRRTNNIQSPILELKKKKEKGKEKEKEKKQKIMCREKKNA